MDNLNKGNQNPNFPKPELIPVDINSNRLSFTNSVFQKYMVETGCLPITWVGMALGLEWDIPSHSGRAAVFATCVSNYTGKPLNSLSLWTPGSPASLPAGPRDKH